MAGGGTGHPHVSSCIGIRSGQPVSIAYAYASVSALKRSLARQPTQPRSPTIRVLLRQIASVRGQVIEVGSWPRPCEKSLMITRVLAGQRFRRL